MDTKNLWIERHPSICCGPIHASAQAAHLALYKLTHLYSWSSLRSHDLMPMTYGYDVMAMMYGYDVMAMMYGYDIYNCKNETDLAIVLTSKSFCCEEQCTMRAPTRLSRLHTV